MSTPIANINPLTDTFESWLDRTNQVSYTISTVAVTTAANASGGYTEGNAHVEGHLSANVLVATEGLRGGNNQVLGELSIVSDLSVESTNSIFNSNVFFINTNTTVNSAYTFISGGALVITSNVNIKSNTVHVSTAGRLGVNTGNPTSTLSVFGTFNVTSNTLLSGNTSIVGPLTVEKTSTFSNLVASNTMLDRAVANSLTVDTLLSCVGVASLSNTTISKLTLTDPLSVSSGGVGRSSLSNNSILTGNGSGSVTLIAPGSSGNLLVSNGTSWVPTDSFDHISATAFTAGMIMMWGGSVASIPTGWALCDGEGGRPDLRDRFIIGARADSGGISSTQIEGSYTKTGGSKDAIVVSHSHTATSNSTVNDPGHFHTLNGAGTASGSGDQEIRNGPGPFTTSTQTTGITVTTSTTISSTGSSGTNANLPPYYALAFIIKL